MGEATPSGVLGVHVANGGFHVKAAAVRLDGRDFFAAKINANFPGNPSAHGLPTIQGMLGLFDAVRGVPLALMDSMSVTTIRTASATAVAAKYLTRADASTLAIIGCGAQALPHVTAMRAVRPIGRVIAFDPDVAALREFVQAVQSVGGLDASAAGDLADAVRDADIVVTCTPARRAFLGASHLRPGAFVGAVGADNEHKSEIEPALMQAACVVVDDIDQCAAIGDLHHAIDAGAMTRADVHATLGDVIVDATRGRRSNTDIVIFDSTGVAIEDVAAGAVVLRRAEESGAGLDVQLSPNGGR